MDIHCRFFRGANQIRTGDRGVADLCLTTWPWRLITNDSNGNRTRVTAVKGRCLNRLTMEPYQGRSVAYLPYWKKQLVVSSINDLVFLRQRFGLP